MNDTYNLILKLRAIRDYKTDQLSDVDLQAILEAARWTGSSKNEQDWSFIAVTNHHRLQELAKFGDYTQPVRDSVATIVLVQEAGGNMFDIGRAAQNMMLAAKAIRVASCPITLHRSDEAQAFLGTAPGSIVRYAVSLGYAADQAQPRRRGGRKTHSEVISIEP